MKQYLDQNEGQGSQKNDFIFEVKFSPITYYTSHVGDIDINRILAETSSTWRDLEL